MGGGGRKKKKMKKKEKKEVGVLWGDGKGGQGERRGGIKERLPSGR